MRRAVVIAIAACLAPSDANSQANGQANRNAYNYAVRCFAVAGFARERGMQTDNGERAFAAAYRLGSNLGNTPQQTRDDVSRRVRSELSTMQRDAAYLSQALSDCQRLGLL